MHEAQLHERSCFLTLTYSDEFLPPDGGLVKADFQKFMKRLRKRYPKRVFRYLHCGEYGEENKRPHYHACLFGEDFRGGSSPATSKSGEDAWTHPVLDELWPLGIHQVGSLTFDSACYVARYVMGKATRPDARDPDVRRQQEAYYAKYERVDADTGEVWSVPQEYVTMSRRPGLGAKWFERFSSDVYPSDSVVSQGREWSPPKYYDRLLERSDPEALERMKVKRREKAEARVDSETPERRRARATNTVARLRHFARDGV